MHAPEPLHSKSPLAGFDCGKPSLNDWLLRHALQAQGSGSARTFVVADDATVLGYYSLVVGQVEPIEAPERVRKGMGQYPIPVMVLGVCAAELRSSPNGAHALLANANQLPTLPA